MKIPVRIAIFILGASLIILGWHRAHAEMLNLQNSPGAPSSSYSPEVLAVGGAFLALVAFAPSPAMLSRWLSHKRRKPVPHARFRRRKS